MSGNLTFINDSVLAWGRNTDSAKIGFKNDADSDTDSYMWFETGDNGNEYFKWRSKQSTTTKDLMNLKWDALYVLVKALFSSEVKISTVNALRIFNSSFGAIFRRSEECLYIIPTRENEGENGDIGPLRPFTLNLRTGRITMGHGLDITGDITTNARVHTNGVAINSGSTSWIDMRNQNVIFGKNAVSTNAAQALLRQDHAERKFFVGGLGNNQFGFYMINNSRTSNGTDGQAYLDKNGNWGCGGRIIPGNYDNFDGRYQLKNTASKAANGWHKDATTGVITQWGTAPGGNDDKYYSVTLPIAFPSAFVSLQVYPIYASAVTSGHTLTSAGKINSTSQFSYGVSDGSSGSISASGVYWIAIGY
ncbi:gp53-like domain-containing protein [Escherichia fergusonii]|uniref:gp53-like domain-containing protein n=1 Tax=Escherichia fergusonii TaxID=564 RepID=UPI00311AB16D